MENSTSKLCDLYPEYIDVVEPIFANFGSQTAFFGQLSIIKSFEDISLVRSTLESNGAGKVLLIDGGGSLRCALLDAELANLASVNDWEGIIVYGCVRDVDELEQLDIGIQALASIPVLAPDLVEHTENVNIPVTFGGVTFLPDDYIYADNTGIIISPDDLFDEDSLKRDWEDM